MTENTASVSISVLTPTYNRANTLPRCYESLEAQTYRDFEWIIVDDGSTDDTEALVARFKEQASFPIKYFKKENGGKHTAVNVGYKHLQGEYLFVLDSDDMFVPDCFEKALRLWNEIPASKRKEYCTVCGRCVRHDNGKMVGDPFPLGINELSHKKQYRTSYHTSGEKCSCMRVDVAREFPFPEPDGQTFIGEGVVWNNMNRKYRQWYTNETFRVYTYDSANGLSRNLLSKRMLNGRYYTFCYLMNHTFKNTFFPIEQYVKTILGVTYIGGFLGKTAIMCGKDIDPLHNKVLVVLGGIFSGILRCCKEKPPRHLGGSL